MNNMTQDQLNSIIKTSSQKRQRRVRPKVLRAEVMASQGPDWASMSLIFAVTLVIIPIIITIAMGA
jgi:hypothetical protein